MLYFVLRFVSIKGVVVNYMEAGATKWRVVGCGLQIGGLTLNRLRGRGKKGLSHAKEGGGGVV